MVTVKIYSAIFKTMLLTKVNTFKYISRTDSSIPLKIMHPLTNTFLMPSFLSTSVLHTQRNWGVLRTVAWPPSNGWQVTGNRGVLSFTNTGRAKSSSALSGDKLSELLTLRPNQSGFHHSRGAREVSPAAEELVSWRMPE